MTEITERIPLWVYHRKSRCSAIVAAVHAKTIDVETFIDGRLQSVFGVSVFAPGARRPDDVEWWCEGELPYVEPEPSAEPEPPAEPPVEPSAEPDNAEVTDLFE